MSDITTIVRWYGALSVVAVAALPFITWLGAGLGPLRTGLVRPLSIVVITAVVWWPAATVGLPFTTPIVVAVLGIFAILNWGVWWRVGRPGLDLRQLVVAELVWVVLFAGYAWFRGFNPEIAYTEKPMEIALLTSISRSATAPAPDPWLAGYGINYYYFGYQTISTLVRLSAVPPATAFNLALATLFASVGTATMSAAGQLVRLARGSRVAVMLAAGVGPLLVLIAGNLETTRRLLIDGRSVIDAGWWQGVGWQASRIIVDHNVFRAGDSRETINEFPAFSFILGDLHPHVLTLPLLASILALGLSLLSLGTPVSRARLAAIGAMAGLLYASNSWDAPTGIALVLLMLVLARRGRIVDWLVDSIVVVISAAIAAFPFALHYSAPVGVPDGTVPGWITDLPIVGAIFNTFGIVAWRPSGARELLIVHGAWLAIFVVFVTAVAIRDRSILKVDQRNRIWLLTAGLLALGIAVAWAPAVIVIGVPLSVAAWFVWRSRDLATQALAALFAFGFTLILIPEFFYIQDVFGDRMNTVFKLYFQAWLVLAVASAAASVVTVFRATGFRRPAATVVLALIIGATLSYTPLSADDWASGFAQRRGLDGEAYIASAGHGDLEIIEWVRAHARDGDTIAEAPGCSYGVLDGVPLNRVSAFTGVPTIVGWLGHESQWRRGQIADIGTFLDTRAGVANAVVGGDRVDARPSPRFVVLGQQELRGNAVCPTIAKIAPDVEARLTEAGWVIVYETSGARIFARPGDATTSPRR